ncbi:hypothetical protein LCGC14_0841240, partial [marine sediment metagenome]
KLSVHIKSSDAGIQAVSNIYSLVIFVDGHAQRFLETAVFSISVNREKVGRLAKLGNRDYVYRLFAGQQKKYEAGDEQAEDYQ